MAGSNQTRAPASSSSAATIASKAYSSQSAFASSAGRPASPPNPHTIRYSQSSRTLRHASAESPEPPSTPPNKHRRPVAYQSERDRANSGGRGGGDRGGRGAATTTTGREPQWDHRISGRRERELQQEEATITTRGDNRHSHGLSWSSNTRDSLVDNLLSSLDGLSQLANHDIDHILREREREDVQWNRHDILNAMAQPRTRTRGHTYSSSISSDRVAPESPASGYSPNAQLHNRRSVSSSNFANVNAGRVRPRQSSTSDNHKDGSAFVLRSQTQHTTYGDVGQQLHAREHSDASSAENNVYAPLETPPKFALGGARSLSLDQLHKSALQSHSQQSYYSTNADSVLSRGRPVPSVFSRYESSFDAAPEPMVPAGPRKLQNPNATGPVYVNPAPKVSSLRKITTQSDLRAAVNSAPPVPPDVREKASDFVRASSMRDTAMMAQTADRALPNNHTNTMPLSVSSNRKDAPSPHREKPGFFKRVFGGGGKSSNERSDNSHSQQSHQSPPPQPQQAQQQVSADHASTHTQPTLSKKPSSFFRRRKKSTSDAAPPPLPPPAVEQKPQALVESRVSVSSLRMVMDQYLTDRPPNVEGGARDKSGASRPTTRGSSASDDLDIFHSGYTPPADAALNKSKATIATQENESPRMKVKLRKHNHTESRPGSRPQSRRNESSNTLQRTPSKFDKTSRPLSSHPPDHFDPSTLPRRPSTPKAADTSADESSGERRAFAAGNNIDLVLSNHNWLTASNQIGHDSSESTLSDRTKPKPLNLALAAAPVRTAEAVAQHASPDPHTDSAAEYRERARRIFDGDEQDISKMEAASWLGETKTLNTRTLHEYMQLFDFAQMNILTALRTLCGKLVLRGETQQFDRIITALSSRWCDCNPKHGFKAQDVVHTICYSLILLNTDLHMANIGEKMSRSAYVKNTLPTVRRVVSDAAPDAFDENGKLSARDQPRPGLPWRDSSTPTTPSFPPDTPQESDSLDAARPNVEKRNSFRINTFRSEVESPTLEMTGSNSLVNASLPGSIRVWETEMEVILKSFFASIRGEPLPLLTLTMSNQSTSDRNLSVNTSGLKRSGSVVSKAPSDIGNARVRGLRSLTMGFQGRNNRSRQKVFMTSTMSSSRTSFDDSNSIWSPTQSSSTWSKNSMGNKTLTSSSMNSLAASYMGSDSAFKHSIGFANALSHAIIREEGGGVFNADSESFTMRGDLLEDESLALEGAPWAKEGMLKHKHHLDGPERKAKGRIWNECFAVISRGKLTLFNFNTVAKTRSLGRPRTKQGQQAPSIAGSKVGGGDWMENAEQLGVFILRHTISTTLPPPGYSKARPFVWALSLPSGAVHLFQVGTPEIANEWMTTANYWSARLSKEPLSGGVSNIEYGWSDAVINPALLEKSSSFSGPPSSMMNKPFGHGHSASSGTIPRQSVASSIRTSFDVSSGSKQRLPGDKVHITDWTPPSQSIMASQASEAEQLRSLTTYVTHVELELEKHHEMKQAIELAFSPRHVNYTKAMNNWQRKSEYLLREAVKFRTYMDSLAAAQTSKEEVYARRVEKAAKSPTSATFASNTLSSPKPSSRDLYRTGSNISASTVSLHVQDA